MSEGLASISGEFSKIGDAETDDLEALDELFHRSARYRHAEEYKKFLDFIGRLSNYSPYNCALLHVQDPGVTHTATRRQWKRRFDRRVSPDARPYVILQPFSPVMLVYDVSQTEPRSEGSPELPKKITDPFEVEGSLQEKTWKQVLENCGQERIRVRETSKLSRSYGGRIESGKRLDSRYGEKEALYLVTLNADMELEERYVVLAHELAHLFLGHVESDEGAWWNESDIPHAQAEIEAESVAYLIARRSGLHSVSERYLHWYKKTEGGEEPIPPVRMRKVLDVADYIEEMGKIEFEAKRDGDDNTEDD